MKKLTKNLTNALLTAMQFGLGVTLAAGVTAGCFSIGCPVLGVVAGLIILTSTVVSL